MTHKNASLLLLWVLMTGLGLAIGLLMGLWLQTDEDYLPFFLLLGFVLGGALMGFGQWLLLHTDYKLSWLWIPATALGIALGLPSGIAMSEFLMPLVIEETDLSYFVVTALIVGATTGTLQWLFTGRKLVSAKWIFVSAISFLGLVLSYASLYNPVFSFETTSWALDVLLFGSLFGVFAGTVSGIFVLPKLTTYHVKERMVDTGSIFFLSAIAIACMVSKLFLYDNGYGNPLRFGSYSNSGYYEIDPETILNALNRGATDVFKLSSEEIWDQERPEYESIRWSQSDYLKIADALSQEVLHEPLDLNKWQRLYLSLDQDCVDNPRGFYDFDIVYFQNAGLRSWSRQYHVRLIQVISWQGIIRWGDTIYSDAVLPGWGNVKLNSFKLTADDALRMAERNGGSNVRQEANNACMISVWFNNYSPVSGYTNNDWLLEYRKTDFYMRINPFSGAFRRGNTDS
jgi:hypothetical protein